jgi:hypothetical protein
VTVQADEISAIHDGWQRAGSDEQWSDSFYFGGGDGRGLAFYSRIGRRPNEGITEGALGLWLPDQGFLLSFAREGVAADIASGPVRFSCLDPLVLWELELGRSGRLYERAEHVATDRDRYREARVNGTIRFTAWHDPLTFRSGLSGAVAGAHYEQPGSVAGVI